MEERDEIDEEFDRLFGRKPKDSEKENYDTDTDTKHKKYDDSNEDQKKLGSNAETLVRLAEENCEQFFKDEYGGVFAVANITDHREVIDLESSKFKHLLSKLFYEMNNHRVAGSDAINNAIQVLQAKAEYEGKTIPLSLRVGRSDNKDSIYYDLTDEKWRCVKIAKDGWNLVNSTDSPILFRRYNQKPQVEPSKNYDSYTLDRFLELANIEDESQRHLLKVYMISLLIPDIPHVMLQLHGEKGSTKSTLQKFIKKIIDPSNPELLTINNDKSEFIQQVSHNYVLYYDNTKYVPKWLPDEVCKAVTGAGTTKRKLYTNNEDIVFDYKRCIGFNGININLTESDALDRSILIDLLRLKKEDRRTESEVMNRFEEMRPQILGYIFDIVSKALKIKETLKINSLPRMADFALFGEAISQAMGYKPYEFLKVYYQNIGTQNIEAIEANPLAQAMVKLIDEYGNINPYGIIQYSAQTTNCKLHLDKIAENHNIDIESKLWPRSPNALSRKLKEIKSNLLEGFGIEVIVSRDSKKNTSFIEIYKIPPEHPELQEDQNQAGNLDGFTGDISNLGGMLSPDVSIPPENPMEIQPQNDNLGDIGGSGDLLGNTVKKEKENQGS